MLRAIGRTALEIARAIDTGHAIRHGVPVTRRHAEPQTAARHPETAQPDPATPAEGLPTGS